MTITSEQIAHSQLVGGGQTALHSHSGGGSEIIKAGSATTNSGGTTSVTFGTAFSDTNYYIALTCQKSDAVMASYASKATTGFTINTYEDKGQAQGSVPVDWIAIHL